MKKILLLLIFVLFACTPPIGVTPTPANTPTVEPTPTQEIIPTVAPTPVPTEGSIWDVDRMRFTYNVNCEETPDFNYLEEHLRGLNPSFIMCMGNINKAIQWSQAFPNAQVVYRDWSVHEGDEWKNKTPKQFVDKWVSYNAPQLIYYTTNEPSFGYNFSQLEDFVEHQVETMRLARERGLTIAAGNLATGVIRPEWIEQGIFDPYLEAIRDYGHYHAAQEYTR